MKKITIGLLVGIILVLASTYIFLPSSFKVVSAEKSGMKTVAVNRYLLEEKNWLKWWPDSTPFRHNKIDFSIINKYLNNFEIRLVYKKDTLKSLLEINRQTNDSTEFVWSCEIASSKNPILRWFQYFDAVNIKKSIDQLISRLVLHIDSVENIYGFKINNVKVQDSVLISTRSNFNTYPDPMQIGQIVMRLKDYIKSQNAVEKNFPMLNVYQIDSNNYIAMVAIATERLLPASKDFAPKVVLKNGNLLEAEIKGGPYTIQKCFKEFENYRTDFHYESPAIPYQLMITDRTKEADTTNWITKFYYPVL